MSPPAAEKLKTLASESSLLVDPDFVKDGTMDTAPLPGALATNEASSFLADPLEPVVHTTVPTPKASKNRLILMMTSSLKVKPMSAEKPAETAERSSISE